MCTSVSLEEESKPRDNLNTERQSLHLATESLKI